MRIVNNLLCSFIFIFSYSIYSQTAEAPSSGDGTSGNPYQIATWQNLYWISQNSSQWNKYYIQTENIDLSAASPSITTWDGNKGWKPIGNDATQFTGSYDGNNKTISGLYINRSGEVILGLFGSVSGSGDKVKNLGVININFINGSGDVGGLAGKLIGGTISKCYSSGNISATGSNFGGLVGSSSATISESYSTVVLNTGSSSGGFVGFVASGTSISNCYARGNVTGTSNVGGFTGYAYQGSISNCYSTGSVSGTSSYGGFAGTGWIATVSNCFWDNMTSSQTSSWGGTGKTTTQMKTQSTFTSWDFTNVWEIIGGDGANYPRLKDNPDPALPVELISFNAKCIMNNVELNWTTATEVNNYGFEIERTIVETRLSSSLQEGWQKIGFVKGSGNSNSPKDYSFVDNLENVASTSLSNTSSASLKYRLKQIDSDGTFSYSNEIEIDVNIPKIFVLHQNYPNPFNPETVIKYEIPMNGKVILDVYDILGRKVVTLVNKEQTTGAYEVKFDGSNLAGGVYFYNLQFGNFDQTKKLLLLK